MSAAAHACSFFLARLRTEITRLRQVVFPGHDTGPRKWLNFISGIIDTAEGYLEKTAEAGKTEAEISKLIKDAEKLGGTAYRYLTHLAGADATQIPHQVVAPFKRWVKRLQINNTIIFRAEHLPNYELTSFDAHKWLLGLNNPTTSLNVAVADITWPARRVTVPSQAMGMLPHFAVVAHELGHAIQDTLKPDFTPHNKALDECNARIKARLADAGLPYGTSDLIRTGDITNFWINELKADAVGYYLAGPAFFFALCGFLELAGQSYGISPTHPPSDLRKELLIGQLSTGTPSFVSVFQDKLGLTITEAVNSPHVPDCPPTDELYNELSLKYRAPDAAICVELVAYARTVAPIIYEAARAHLSAVDPALIYLPEELNADIDRHLESLCQLIPPIEYLDGAVVKPAALSSILNIGWAVLLT